MVCGRERKGGWFMCRYRLRKRCEELEGAFVSIASTTTATDGVPLGDLSILVLFPFHCRTRGRMDPVFSAWQRYLLFRNFLRLEKILRLTSNARDEGAVVRGCGKKEKAATPPYTQRRVSCTGYEAIHIRRTDKPAWCCGVLATAETPSNYGLVSHQIRNILRTFKFSTCVSDISAPFPPTSNSSA